MRAGIQAYNRAHADRVRTGYHETVTVAFMRLIADAVDSGGSGGGAAVSSGAFCESNPSLLDPDVLSRYYSAELLSDPAARQDFVPPDRAPLPRPPGTGAS